MKTSELQGPALDWAVAKCEGLLPAVVYNKPLTIRQNIRQTMRYNPSTDWALGGPILYRERIGIDTRPSLRTNGDAWVAVKDNNGEDQFEFDGPTPLTAIMRCYVASKLGDDIEIPEELRL